MDTPDNKWLKELLHEVRTETAEARKTLYRIDATLIEQHGTLEEHQRRSVANEAALELLRKEVKPLALHVAVVGALGKVLGAVATLVGIAAGIAKLLGH